MTETEPKYKTPKFQTKIHLPELPGSFTFRKSGKLRLDQQVKKFCLLNNCRGCFEVKVHFGVHINPNKINYDANQNGIFIDTLNQQQKYKLFVSYPKGFELIIPKDPEAQFFCGVLSAKLAIIKYDKTKIMSSKKRTNKNKTNLTKTKTDELVSETVENTPKSGKNVNEKSRKKKRNQKRSRLSLDELNKRIAKNSDNSPAKKKRKLNKSAPKKKQKVKETQSHDMNIDDAHKLIDGVVDKIDAAVKKKRHEALQKEDEVKEYLQRRAEKKKNKELRKKELREKFLERRNAKKKITRMQNNVPNKTSAKKVRFNV